jgi:hypothetical protein
VSNSLAIATVTAALQARLRAAFNAANLSEQIVSTSHPPSSNAQAGAYVFLYQVEANTALRNLDLPTRDASGALTQRPQLALCLQYIVSFVGDPGKLEAERLLGLTVASLHAEPLLSKQELQEVIDAAPPDSFLRGSDLAERAEPVRFTARAMDLETMSRLWSMFNQVPYALSVAYEASFVLVDGPAPAVGAPLPALSASLRAIPAGSPRVDRIEAADPRLPILAGARIAIQGSRLTSARLQIRIDGQAFAPSLARPERLELNLDPALAAGWKVLEVVHLVDFAAAGEAPRERVAAVSPAVAFVLRPSLELSASGVEVTDSGRQRIRLSVVPAVVPGQRLALLLNQKGGGPSYALEEVSVDGSLVVFTFDPIAPGSYLVRLRVDGADSLLGLDDGEFSSPSLVVP